MITRRTHLLLALAAALLGLAHPRSHLLAAEPWTEKQLKAPADLAAALNNPKAAKIVIFNVGPIEQIKGATFIGAGSDPDNLKELREKASKLPKDQEIVIYCGCCPFSKCPNVRPAFELLKEMKFTNLKLLNLPSNLNADWIRKGYPME
jgi:thiosulfate/3-mercaptopyruvate sulfurtransferase